MSYMMEHQGYQIKPHKEFTSNYIVVVAGKGGKIPDVLTGVFTSKAAARDAIDTYLLYKPKKETTNAEAVDKG